MFCPIVHFLCWTLCRGRCYWMDVNKPKIRSVGLRKFGPSPTRGQIQLLSWPQSWEKPHSQADLGSSSSHFGAGEACLTLAGQQERQWPGFPEAKQVPTLYILPMGWKGRNAGQEWLGLSHCVFGVTACATIGKDLLLMVVKVVFILLRELCTTWVHLSAHCKSVSCLPSLQPYCAVCFLRR